MQEEHRRAIQNNFGSLVEQTDLDLIVSALYEKGVFSEAMIEPYRDINKDSRSRKRQMYRDIERRGPTAFESLLESLTETGHWDLVRSLDPHSVLHPRRDNHKEAGPSLPVQPQQQYVSLSKNKEPVTKKIEDDSQQVIPSTSKTPYPLDFSQPDETSAEIPNFDVVKAEKFYEESKAGIPLYPTRGRHRGVLIAFSFIEFKNNIDEYRKGAEVDCKNLKYLFNEMGFRTVFYNNLTKKETEDTLNCLRSVEYMSEAECVFVVVSSHGYERGRSADTDVRAADGRLLSILGIIEHFNNANFPGLRGVPKVFVFQTCRGSSEEHVWSPPPHMLAPQRPATDGSPRGAGAPPPPLPAEPPGLRAPPLRPPEHAHERLYSDILIAHSTLPGFVSRRDSVKGSWYIQALCAVFAARAHDCHVEQLFTLVDRALHDRFGAQTSSIDKWGFNNRLYLHPGLFDH